MKIKKLVPAHERVLVLMDEPPTETKGGILLPDEEVEVPTTGIIKVMGNKAIEELPDFKVGDKIMTMKYSGLAIKVNEVEHKLIMSNDIIAKVETEE